MFKNQSIFNIFLFKCFLQKLQRREQFDIVMKEREQARIAALQKYVQSPHLQTVFHPHNSATATAATGSSLFQPGEKA